MKSLLAAIGVCLLLSSFLLCPAQASDEDVEHLKSKTSQHDSDIEDSKNRLNTNRVDIDDLRRKHNDSSSRIADIEAAIEALKQEIATIELTLVLRVPRVLLVSTERRG